MRFSFARITLAAMFAVLLLIAIATTFLVHFSLEQERLASQRVPSYAGKLLARQIEAIRSTDGTLIGYVLVTRQFKEISPAVWLFVLI